MKNNQTFLPDLKNSRSILSTRKYKQNCLPLTITASRHPVKEHATRDRKYVINLIVPRQQIEDGFAYIFAYIIRKQNICSVNIWLHTPCGDSKVDLFKSNLFIDFDKDR